MKLNKILLAAVLLALSTLAVHADPQSDFDDSPALKAIKAEAWSELESSDGTCPPSVAIVGWPALTKQRSLALLPLATDCKAEFTSASYDNDMLIVFGKITPADARPRFIGFDSKGRAIDEAVSDFKENGSFRLLFSETTNGMPRHKIVAVKVCD